jgi:hypothetical protein
MKVARSHREAAHRAQVETAQRLTRLESGPVQSGGLPERLRKNEVDTAVDSAIREERHQIMDSIRKTIIGGFAAASAIAAVLSVVLPFLINGASG